VDVSVDTRSLRGGEVKNSIHRLVRAEQWADQICTQLGKSVESIIEVGRLLSKAKADLAHGEWGRIFDERLIPVSHRTANFYMVVASHPLVSNSKNFSNLPATVSTLYKLTKLPEPTLKHALADGLITPDMPSKAVKALLPVERKPAPVIDVLSAQADAVDDFEMPRWADDEIRTRVQAALQPVRELIEGWPDDQDFSLLMHQLTQITRYIERLAQRHEVSA
jgi:hypothetical protein